MLRGPALLRLALRVLALGTAEEVATLAPHALEPRVSGSVPASAFGKFFSLQVHFDALAAAAPHAASDTAIAAKLLTNSPTLASVPFESVHALLFRLFAQLRVNTVAVKQLISSENGTEQREVTVAHAVYANVRCACRPSR